MKQLICDSGGTKSSWILTDDSQAVAKFDTEGMNPAVSAHEHIESVISTLPEYLKEHSYNINKVWFYGAGCVNDGAAALAKMLTRMLPGADISVNSDMLGAARALCQSNEGIACILGTGANSCYYDGRRIRQNTPALGYILGDEGGGAVLGKTLINSIYKGLFPARLKQTFEEEMHTDMATIIENVYRKPFANRYLASFTHFLSAHRDEACIHNMLTQSFRQFFERNITPYDRPDLSVSFVGSLAYHFETELREAAGDMTFQIGKIIQNPIDYLAQFHIKYVPERIDFP